MNKKSKIELYEEILESHGYARCSFCNKPIIDKNNKINIVRERFTDGKVQRRLISSHHKKCEN